MARKILFAKQTVARFQPDATFGGLYAAGFNFPESGFGGNIADSFELVVGNTYTVEWDGVEYDVTAQDASLLSPGLIGLGNGAAFGLSGNNEPFIVAQTNGMGFNLVSFDQAVSHEAGIYEDVADEEPEEPDTPPEEPEEPEGIVLKDRNGNDVAYYGIETVTFDTTTEGKQQTFTKGEAVEGLEIEPDFSGGDMAVAAPGGKLVKSATIKKPAELVPGNIKKGVYISGVVGDMTVESEAATVELDFRDFTACDSVDAMKELASDAANNGKYVKYTGETGEYVNGQFYQMISSAEAAKNSNGIATDIASGTELTAAIDCKVGDLLIAAFAIRSDLVSLSNGWNLISISQDQMEINPASTVNQTLSFAYKYATSDNESITVTQTTAARIYINMVAISGASGLTDCGYQYQNNGTAEDAKTAIFNRPSESLIVWGATRSVWKNDGAAWEISNNSLLIQLGPTLQSRLLLAVDDSEDETVEFITGTTSTIDAFICGALSIEMEHPICFIPVSTVPDYVENQIIRPPDGMLINQVNIKKPENLIPENIAEGVTIAGIGPGTHSGGGGLELDEEPWLDDVCFWDYDGTLILNIPMNQVAQMTALPIPPSHSGLTFQGWNYTLEQIKATEYPLDVGALYIPTDGNTHVHLDVTNTSYRAMFFNFAQTVSNGVSINWGDGTAATTVSGTGVVKATHTYSAIGQYEVVFTVAEGCVMTLGDATNSLCFIGGSSSTSTYRNYAKKLHIGNRVTIGAYGVNGGTNLSMVTIPRSAHITEIPNYGVSSVAVNAMIIPDSVVSLGNGACGSYSQKTFMAVCIPESVTSVGTNFIHTVQYAARAVVPRYITALPDYGLYNLYSAKRVFMPDGITSFGSRILYNAYRLLSVKLPEKLETMGDYCLNYCYCLGSIRIPRSVKTIGNSVLSLCAVRDLYVPDTVQTVGQNFGYATNSSPIRLVIAGTTTFSNSSNNGTMLKEIIHLTEQVPSVVHTSAYKYFSVWVPDTALAAYKAVYETSTSYARVFALSEYRGKLPNYN